MPACGGDRPRVGSRDMSNENGRKNGGCHPQSENPSPDGRRAMHPGKITHQNVALGVMSHQSSGPKPHAPELFGQLPLGFPAFRAFLASGEMPAQLAARFNALPRAFHKLHHSIRTRHLETTPTGEFSRLSFADSKARPR